ncbi:MAG: methionyl-tRNA formyltransferase [Gammaproteobacteria bacterium]|nr:MAG: methionyl-tRNA formyltransferase [Gammaproteobacteria bacterium]
MNIVFAGTPEFSVASLQALIDAGHNVTAVFTQPDRRAGRGKKIVMSPVKQRSLDHGIPVFQPEKLKSFDLAQLEKPGLMVVVAYGLILPQPVLDWPELGCINVHASLLPRWRGAAPIQRAIEAGDRESGVCIMQMDAGLDTGDILSRAAITLDEKETGGSLHDKLATLGAGQLVQTVAALENGAVSATPQSDQGASYAGKLRREEAKIRWDEPAVVIERRIRAFNPWPSTWTTFRDKPMKVHLGEMVHNAAGKGAPGEVIQADRDGLVVSAGNGALRLATVQPAGKKPMAGVDLVNGYQVKKGERLG